MVIYPWMYVTLSRIQTVTPFILVLPRFYQMIWFIASQHDTHQKQFFKLLELIKALVYVNYYRLTERMIVQKGRVLALDQASKEAAAMWKSSHRKSMEPTTGS